MKYFSFCFVFVLGVLQFNSLLGVDLQSDLAKLDVELSSLSKMIPAVKKTRGGSLPNIPKPKAGVFEGVKKGMGNIFEGAKKWAGFGKKEVKEVSFEDAKKYWPASTEIKIGDEFKSIDDGIESLKRAGKGNIPEGTIIRAPGFDKVELKIGEKSYTIWSNIGFYSGDLESPGIGLVFLAKDDIEDFPDKTKIYIKTEKSIDAELIIGDEKIDISDYLDEKNRLLGIVKVVDVDGNTYQFSDYISFNPKRIAIEEIIEAD